MFENLELELENNIQQVDWNILFLIQQRILILDEQTMILLLII
jgi:hypothetical protein